VELSIGFALFDKIPTGGIFCKKRWNIGINTKMPLPSKPFSIMKNNGGTYRRNWLWFYLKKYSI
jgi:hypothetical protein